MSWLWLFLSAAGAACFMASVVLYHRRRPTTRIPYGRNAPGFWGWPMAMRMIGISASTFSGVMIGSDTRNPWVAATTVLAACLPAVVAMVVINQRVARAATASE